MKQDVSQNRPRLSCGESRSDAEDFGLCLMDVMFLRSLDEPVELLTVALFDTVGHCDKFLLMRCVL